MRTSFVRGLAFAAALGVLAACDAAPTDPALADAKPASGPTAGVVHEHHLPPAARREFAALRALTAPFHRFEAGREAGWDEQLTPCLEHPTDGGMGYHFGNPAYLGDEGAYAALEPEVLVYEPMRNGRYRLGAVEYIVPFDFAPPDGPAPELFGQAFHRNPGVPPNGAWVLHVWLWTPNPSGLFADWNPNVSCLWAPPPAGT